MERYAVDFGTSNTVVARWNFAREEPQTMSFPAINAKPILPNMQWYAPTTMDGVQDTMKMPASFTTVHKATGLLGLPI